MNGLSAVLNIYVFVLPWFDMEQSLASKVWSADITRGVGMFVLRVELFSDSQATEEGLWSNQRAGKSTSREEDYGILTTSPAA